LKRLTKRVVERVLEAELTAHLGYAPHVRNGTEEQNARNGKSQKTVQTATGPLAGVCVADERLCAAAHIHAIATQTPLSGAS